RNHGQAAIIGVGGGRDVLSAYLFGFRDVTGVELNPIFIELLTGRFRTYNRAAELPGVRLYVDEARSWFARTRFRFDLVQMILIDSAPLSVDEVAKLRAATTELGFTVLVSPDQPTSSLVLAQVLQADTPEAFDRLVRSYHIDLTPPTDDRPFFFNQLILTDFTSIRDAQQAPNGVVRGNLE